VNDEDQIPYKKPRKRRKPTILPLDLTQTYTTIKPNKIKGDISRIKAKPPQRLINPPFNLLKPKQKRLN